MLSNLFTPTDYELFNEGVLDHVAFNRSWKQLDQYVQTQSNMLLWFEALSEGYVDLHHAHESCKDVKLRYNGCINELSKLQAEHKDKVGEMVRHRIVKEWLPTFVRWLHQIHEYKRSLGDVFSLAITFGWLRGVSVNWSEEAVRVIMTDTNNIDPAAAATFIESRVHLLYIQLLVPALKGVIKKVGSIIRHDDSGYAKPVDNVVSHKLLNFFPGRSGFGKSHTSGFLPLRHDALLARSILVALPLPPQILVMNACRMLPYEFLERHNWLVPGYVSDFEFLEACYVNILSLIMTAPSSSKLSATLLTMLRTLLGYWNLKVHEMIIKKDSEIVKAKGEIKSLALKAKKESSDEESLTFESKDEEYAMAVRDFKKFFKRRGRCGDPNLLIRECPKTPKYKNQRAFVRGSWSDSGEEDDEKAKDEICLVAQVVRYALELTWNLMSG
ncbi:hypothetical protein Tco_0916905 [Tanacetum coccineum]